MIHYFQRDQEKYAKTLSMVYNTTRKGTIQNIPLPQWWQFYKIL